MHIRMSLCDHQDVYPPTKVIRGLHIDCGIMHMHIRCLGFRYEACVKILGFSLGLVFFQAMAKLECVSCLVVVNFWCY